MLTFLLALAQALALPLLALPLLALVLVPV